MLKIKVVLTLLLFAFGILAVACEPAIAQNGYWQHRWSSQFARRPFQFRQEPPWRRWGPARQTSFQSVQSQTRTTGSHDHPYELSRAPTSIGPYNPGHYDMPRAPSSNGLYNPGNISSSVYTNRPSSRPNVGYPSPNGGGYGSAERSTQSAAPSYQAAGPSSQNVDLNGPGRYQPSETRYTCIVAGGYCLFTGAPNISSGSVCHCGQDSGFTR